MITIKSHGFKFSRPEANLVFDASYLVNPWRKEELRGSSREKILEFMESQEEYTTIVNMIANSISTYNSLWKDSEIVCAICCSEGSYRSPMVVESVAKILKEKGISFKIKHQYNER